jgi:hypothetical protein
VTISPCRGGNGDRSSRRSQPNRNEEAWRDGRIMALLSKCKGHRTRADPQDVPSTDHFGEVLPADPCQVKTQGPSCGSYARRRLRPGIRGRHFVAWFLLRTPDAAAMRWD